MNPATNWTAFLDDYHATRPGITEDLLAPARNRDGRSPYAWLVEDLPASGPVLDLACGSAPLHALLGGRWIGLDRSAGEVTRAIGRGAAPLVRGDGVALPFDADTFPAVVCSMALMLLEPTDQVLQELRRVLQPDGSLHLLLPAVRPLTVRDRTRFARLYLTLRRRAQLPPTSFRRHPRPTLERHGFQVLDDVRQRFAYPLDTTEAANRLVDGLYLPGVSEARRNAGRATARRWIGSTIGLPLRRIVATRQG